MVKNSKIDVNGVSERIKKSHPTFSLFHNFENKKNTSKIGCNVCNVDFKLISYCSSLSPNGIAYIKDIQSLMT